jgi:hypothetical protein
MLHLITAWLLRSGGTSSGVLQLPPRSLSVAALWSHWCCAWRGLLGRC